MQLAAWALCLGLFFNDAARPAGRLGRHSLHRRRGYGEPGWRYGEASNPGPLRVTVNLGTLQVDALLDTGSDLDAIDRDLSIF